ncbi:sialate O-acetylesterase [Neolewinella litorea]|uniref:sialate O-acetylesterase n=1 Tax=Neolewinella litorea TaxID=2562452 RepID=UPI001455E8DD|nr:sialate O-acetylesterase [Neolewinella litorea]
MRLLLSLLPFLIGSVLVAQDLSFFAVFTDHAVLQRNVPHPVWGENSPNRKVTLSLDDQSFTVRTDRNGKWSITLPPTPAGGPHTLTVSDGSSTIALRDIYFGDVYLLSGQSNMEWRLAQSDPDSARARTIADPLIRQILVAKSSSDSPAETLALDEKWVPGTPEEMADFSGVGAYFAHYLRESGVRVPIGLLHSSWGGSRIEAWLPDAALTLNDRNAASGQRARLEAAALTTLQTYRNTFGSTDPPPTEDRGREEGFLADDTDLSDWGTMSLPAHWESQGYPDVDGVFYFRKTFSLTAEQASGEATLHLGAIDDGDLTYINGEVIGTTPNAYAQPRHYSVPATTLRAGRNSLAIRVSDTGGNGGFADPAEALYLETESSDKIPLHGDYHYRIGVLKMADARANHTPTLLYNAMIAPLQNLPVSAVLWYQGESNAGADDAPRYAHQLRALVSSWRRQLQSDTLPFYWVQLADYQAPPQQPDEPGWAVIREQQSRALDLPRTGQAVITDIGDADDIHPLNKWEVGRRLSLHARKDIYGHDVQARSPIATMLEVFDRYSVVHFSEVGEGLTLRQTPAQRYPLVGSLTVEDDAGAWHWAVSTLDAESNTLIILNPGGRPIRRVRYAWFNNPDDANLFSRQGLPVTPFEIGPDGK